MIVASIPITFKSGRAADLLGHMTETGREYEFIPDITLPEGCSAAIEIVKPDGMFVITECSIVEGNIIVTLPAQALAVRGLAHYIIRITTADDKIIFSAAGSIWVDDALITNELLESISEVYGLTFPDDFLTTADLADYVTIDDLRAALSDYALKTDIIDVVPNPSGAAAADLSKIKIGSEIYKIPDPLERWSENEQIVGIWTDGRPVYKKSFNFAIPSNNYVTVATSINNFDMPIKYGGIVALSSGVFEDICYNRPDSDHSTYYTAVVSTGDFFFKSYEAAAGTAYITMLYLKQEV